MKNVLVKDPKNEILELCKKGNEKLVFVELGRDMFKGNEYILNKYFRNENGYACYYPNLLAFREIKSILTPKELKAILRKDFGKEVDLTGYRYNPEHFKYIVQEIQDDYDENLFREQEDEVVSELNQIDSLDFEAVKSLSRIIDKAIRKRTVILFELEDVPGIINNALDCYCKGVSCRQANEAMRAKLAKLNSLLNDKEVIEWIKSNPTDMLFDKEDYIETYQRVMRTLTSCKESLEEYRDCIHNDEDLFEDDIIENNYIECDSYEENEEYSDEDESEED